VTITRPFALLVAASLVLVACGGDDDGSSVAEDPPAEEPAGSTATAGDGPVSTLSPDIPEAFLPGLGPVDVDGESLPFLENPEADPAIGLAVPVLTGLDLDRDPIRIDPAENGPTMVVFVAHWCPHCNEELPRINQLRDDGLIPEGLNVVAISTSATPERPNWPPDEWLTDDMEWTYPAMYDGIDVESPTFIAAAAYGVNAFPFTVLVDGDGVVVARWSGERAADEIAAAIENSLSLN
jgi:cytochrome c biogenesis protein CcmG, thiol:disulfide interchange protein DsbE